MCFSFSILQINEKINHLTILSPKRQHYYIRGTNTRAHRKVLEDDKCNHRKWYRSRDGYLLDHSIFIHTSKITKKRQQQQEHQYLISMSSVTYRNWIFMRYSPLTHRHIHKHMYITFTPSWHDTAESTHRKKQSEQFRKIKWSDG